MSSNEIPPWAIRLQAHEARAIEAIARVPLIDRIPHTVRARALQLIATIALLALGVSIGEAAIWVLIAIPLTAVVLLALLHGTADEQAITVRTTRPRPVPRIVTARSRAPHRTGSPREPVRRTA